MLEMAGVSRVYSTDVIQTRALDDFSIRVDPGEFVAVTGPSGSGKTTFLNIAGLLETFDSGCLSARRGADPGGPQLASQASAFTAVRRATAARRDCPRACR